MNKIITASLLACALVFTPGCKTTSAPSTPEQSAQKAQRLGTVAELAAFTGTTVWLRDHPQDRQYFEASRATLDLLLGSSNITPETFSQALFGLPVKELQGESGALIVGSSLILYDAFVREHVNMDANVYLRPVVQGVRNGLDRGLSQNAVEALRAASALAPQPSP